MRSVPGSNHRSEFLPDHPPHRLCRPDGLQALRRRLHLSRILNNLVAPVPPPPNRLRSCPTLCYLRSCLPLYRSCAPRSNHFRPRLDPKCGHGSLRRRFFFRLNLFRCQLRRRGRGSRYSVDLPRLCHPRHTANLRCRTVVLGLLDHQSFQHVR